MTTSDARPGTTNKTRNLVRRPSLLIILLCLSTISSVRAHDDTDTSLVRPFPGTKIFPLFTADGLSHQLSLSRITENREWIGAVGGSVPLVQWTSGNLKLQTGVAVTIFNRLIKTPGHLEVSTVDYKVDFPVDVRLGALALRVAAGHISCHFADDAIELHGRRSIQHVNDYITLAASYDIAPTGGYVYGGFNYSYGTQPVQHKPWLFQFGSHIANVPVHDEVTLYGAFDVKIRQETGWGSTRSIQMGAKLFARTHLGLRLAYTLRMGFEDRGQFYLTSTTYNLFSAFIDF